VVSGHRACLDHHSAAVTRAADYERHRPEETPLYGIVETYYPQFLARLDAEGGSLPAYVEQEFDDYLKCGRLEHGFLRVKCDACRGCAEFCV